VTKIEQEGRFLRKAHNNEDLARERWPSKCFFSLVWDRWKARWKRFQHESTEITEEEEVTKEFSRG